MARAVHWLLGFVSLQLIFAAIIPAVTSTVLDQSNGDCYLNLVPGRVCDFVYVTSGFSLFFSLLLLAGSIATLRGYGDKAYLVPIYASLSFFGSFWWMVAAITFTQRAKQAEGDGLPEGAARNAVVGLSWIEFALFLFCGVAVVYDRWNYRQYRLSKTTHSVLDLEQQKEFKQQYVATQALGATPIA